MIEVKSPAFSEGDEVPTQFTCDGENISPPSLVGRPRGSRGAARQPDGPRRATRTVHALARHRRRPLIGGCRAGEGAGGRDRADERLRRDDVRRTVSAARVSSSLCLHR
jgi:hypothetical protein